MSQENVELVRRWVEAFNRRELLLDDFDPDVEWVEDQRYPGAETFHGPAGVERSLKKWWDAWSEITMHLVEVIDLGDRVVVAGHTQARGHGSDVSVTAEFGGVYEFRRRKIVRVQVLGSRADALEAAGLSELSQENLDLLRRASEYVERTGEILPEAVHPDIVWDVTTFRGAIIPGTFVGVEEVNEWLAEWIEGFEDWSLDIEEVFDAGDQVVTIVRQRGKAKHGGPEVEMRFAQVWTFRDGLIARMEMYADRNEALEAAGLRE